MEPSLPFGRHSCWKDLEGEDEDRPERASIWEEEEPG